VIAMNYDEMTTEELIAECKRRGFL